MKTLTGKDLLEAFAQLDRELPPGAYKAIQGGKGQRLGLTDINSAYIPGLLTELFGAPGYGWGYDLLETEFYEASDKNGPHPGVRVRICAWYRFDDNGEIRKSDGMPVWGASDNDKMEWALKGAITNALGAGWYLHGFQVSVYKGERSHQSINGGNGNAPPRRPVTEKPPAPTYIKYEDVKTELEGVFSLDELKQVWANRYPMMKHHYKAKELRDAEAVKNEMKAKLSAQH